MVCFFSFFFLLTKAVHLLLLVVQLRNVFEWTSRELTIFVEAISWPAYKEKKKGVNKINKSVIDECYNGIMQGSPTFFLRQAKSEIRFDIAGQNFLEEKRGNEIEK